MKARTFFKKMAMVIVVSLVIGLLPSTPVEAETVKTRQVEFIEEYGFWVSSFGYPINNVIAEAGIDTSEWIGCCPKENITVDPEYIKVGRFWQLWNPEKPGYTYYSGCHSDGDEDDIMYQKYCIDGETEYKGKKVYVMEQWAEGIDQPYFWTLQPGETTIYIHDLVIGDNSYDIEIPVKIKKRDKKPNKITGAKDSYSMKTSKKDQTLQLKIKAKGGDITYKSDNKKVTVSEDGLITIKKGFKGTAKIVVKAGNWKYETATKEISIVVK